MATYLDQFLDSLKFFSQLHPDIQHPDLEEMKRNILSYQTGELADFYNKFRQGITAVANLYIEGAGGIQAAALNAHTHSQGLMTTWNQSQFGEACPLCVTIGNLYYKGTNLFPTTRDGIRSMIQRGKDRSAPIQGHFWLTADDMTVVDPTIISTLARWGKYPETKAKQCPTIIWREDSNSDFCYKPLLIDNTLFALIDEGPMVYDFGPPSPPTKDN
jgi:hypothetical protein